MFATRAPVILPHAMGKDRAQSARSFELAARTKEAALRPAWAQSGTG
jgi:hypothetical protein